MSARKDDRVDSLTYGVPSNVLVGRLSPGVGKAEYISLADVGSILTANGSLNANSGLSGIEVTDGTHDLKGVVKITITGAVVGGTAPNATLTITSGGIEVTDGTTDITGATKETFAGSAQPSVSGTSANATITINAMLPLTDGSTPGPLLVADPLGQCIGVFI